MTMPKLFGIVLAFVIASPSFGQSVSFTVNEATGLRRFGYPVTASLECPSGGLSGPEMARLVSADGKEVPAQFTSMTKWPDGSVRGLDVDFSPSPGPMETLTYRVEMGTGPSQSLRGGLSVTETPEEIVVGSAAITHRIRRNGAPLLSSVAFGDNEFIGTNGIRTTLAPGPAEVVKRGPLNVTLKVGAVRLEYVNTKSWVKITQQAEGQRELSVDAHINLTKLPLLWDFGGGSWLYGNMNKPAQTVTMKHHNSAWDILTAPDSVFATTKSFDGCGHLSDADRAAAFGVVDASKDTELKLTADGRIRITAKRSTLVVYFHFVGQPIPVTAVTSPQAMIAPLQVQTKSLR